MCEVAVVVVDKTNVDDFYKDCQCYKSGDIIEVVADGWPWGTIDLTNPNWRIIKFPGIGVNKFTQFLSAQIPTDPFNPSKTLLRRAVRFAYQAIVNTNWAAAHPAATTTFKNYIADSTRQNATLTVPLNIVQALIDELPVMTVVKPLVQDPAVIG